MRFAFPTRTRRAALDEAAARYSRAPLPGARTPWRQANWCVLDFELTGLDPREDEIISFGAIPIDDGRLQLRRAISGLVRPVRESSEASVRVHGIRTADLARAPVLADAIDPLLRTISGRVLVAHAAAVERAFLGRALKDRGVRLRGPVVDTEVLGCLWLHARDGRVRHRIGLGELASALGLPAERPHDALGDALTTAQVFIALTAHLAALYGETVGSLARAPRRLETLRTFDVGTLSR
ncbi:MAG: exonuclease domain-containing protein [Actinomycetota bacterium]|nr:exonuclease domain-containing protein [Actinomycetota bacterium]